MTRKRRQKRGHPIALLLGFEVDHVVLWRIFSRVIKLSKKIILDGKRTEEKNLYNFHESVIYAIKPFLKEGVRSIVVISSARKTYAREFLKHIEKHHKYLIQSKSSNRANFAELVGSKDGQLKVTEIIKTKEFKELIAETTSEEADQVVSNLEKHLYGSINNSVVYYSLREIENVIFNREKSKKFRTEYLLLTDKYLFESKEKNRINKLLQIANNKKVKTIIINTETSAGNRVNQFGGIVFFSKK